MDYTRKIKLSNKLKMLVNGDRVILVHTENCTWIKLSKECYDIIINAIDQGLTPSQLLMHVPNDTEYFDSLLNLLDELNIINDSFKNEKSGAVITYNITDRCNLSCSHCCVDASNINKDEELDTKDVFFVLDNIINCNPSVIVISGGEPLVRRDFFEIINYVKQKFDGELSLMTNGLLINNQNVKKIIEVFDSIDISIDGVDEESCSKIRGAGVFKKVIENIQIIKSYNYNKISLSMVKTFHTYKRIEEFYKLNEELGTKPIVRLLASTGRADKNLDYLIRKKEFCLSNKESVPNSTIGAKVRSFSSSNDKNSPTVFSCDALIRKFYIDYIGNIYPCAGLVADQFKLDNIFNISSLYKYIRDKKYLDHPNYKNFQNIMPYNLEPCSDCNINMFCIGCPLYPYLYKKEGYLDEYCERRKNMYNPIIWSKINE